MSAPAWASIRHAKPQDRDAVLAMQCELLAAGGEILPTQHNLGIYGRLFDSYISGEVPGVVFVATAGDRVVGFTMAGLLPESFETTWGQTAMGWGTFVEPEHRNLGIAKRLRLHLDASLRALGFDTILGGYDPANVTAEISIKSTGFKVFQHLGAKRLRETGTL